MESFGSGLYVTPLKAVGGLDLERKKCEEQRNKKMGRMEMSSDESGVGGTRGWELRGSWVRAKVRRKGIYLFLLEEDGNNVTNILQIEYKLYKS